MSSFIRFINHSKYTAISIFNDGFRLFSDILISTITPYVALSEGTREIVIKQNTDHVFIDSQISLAPNNYFTLLIKTDMIYLIEEPPTTIESYFSYVRVANFTSFSNIHLSAKNILFSSLLQNNVSRYLPILASIYNFSCSTGDKIHVKFEPQKNYTLYLLEKDSICTVDRNHELQLLKKAHVPNRFRNFSKTAFSILDTCT